MRSYFEMVNSWQMYVICGAILLFLTIMCVSMLQKSYRLGIEMGMPKELLKKVVIASASFSALPAISILIGMIALSGTLGVPMAWMRLSVIGALQYELQVTDISLQALGYNGVGDISAITASDFGAIALVMAVGIIGGLICCIFALKFYMNKIEKKASGGDTEGTTKEKKKSFATYASICMFVGMCSAYFGAYLGDAVKHKNMMPLLIACTSGVCMLIFEALSKNEKLAWLEDFALAASMLIGMFVAVIIG